jgi:lipopolysaccharide/colanic/teichoic acid biosynthesis glycosyltransferase
MAKRFIDLCLAAVALVILSPVFVAAAAGVRLTSPGPVFYRARRMGRGGSLFVMWKFRTMHVRPETGSAITSHNDSRVFLVGRILRALKIDELPQLWNVLKGEMSFVGPRPEDPRIVAHHYDAIGMETLLVAPGLASPGSLFNYTHGHQYLNDNDPEGSYVHQLLPLKLAMEAVYVRHSSLWYDFQIVLRTAITILQIAAGRRSFPQPPEFELAKTLLSQPEAQPHGNSTLSRAA